MNVTCLLEAIEAARENWGYVLGLVPDDKKDWKSSDAAWSVKDIIAHVAWHELEMINLIESRDLEGSPWWMLPTDERNAKIYEQYRDQPLEDVLSIAKDAYPRMLEALRMLSDEDLNDPSRFKNMPEDWEPWRLIANNSYEHYLRHIGQIRKLADQANR